MATRQSSISLLDSSYMWKKTFPHMLERCLGFWRAVYDSFVSLQYFTLWGGKLSSLSSVVKRYVCAKEAAVVGRKRKRLESRSVFEREAASFFYMNPTIYEVFGHHFHEFQRFTVQCGQLIGSILITKHDVSNFRFLCDVCVSLTLLCLYLQTVLNSFFFLFVVVIFCGSS